MHAVRALVFEGPGSIGFTHDGVEPDLQADSDALVRVSTAGLCGSDLHPYLGREPLAPGTVPGHEAVGLVEATGRGVGRLEVGARVIVPFTTSCGGCAPCAAGLSARCERGALFGWRNPDDPTVGLDGCQAELVRVPLAASTLVAAGDVEDSAAILLADNLPTALAAFERARVGDSLTVVGLGSVGLCVVGIARERGVSRIIAMDPDPRRSAIARSMGATIAEPGDAEPTAAVVEAAGTEAAQRAAVDVAAPGSIVSIISVQTSEQMPFTPIEAYDKNLTVVWGRAPVRSILDRQMRPLASIASHLADLIVDRPDVALAEGPGTYAAFAERQFVKAAFVPSG